MMRVTLVGLLMAAPSANAFLVGRGPSPAPPCTAAPAPFASRTTRLVVLGAASTRESDTTAIAPDELDSPFLREADAIFDAIDANGDGAISNDELRAHLGGLGCAPAAIRALFTALDRNADGAISRAEMRSAFATYETSTLCQAFGVGEECVIAEAHGAAVAALRANAQLHATDEPLPLLLTKLADLIFDKLDADASGEIDAEELKAHFLENGEWSTFREIGNASAVSAEAVMKALDLNRDGVISREEMRDGFRQYDLQGLSRALGLQVSRTGDA